MGKKFTFVFSSILLLGVLFAWLIDRLYYPFLPPDFSNLGVMLLSVLGVVSALVGAVKAIQFIGELFFPPPPDASEEDKLLQKLRNSPWAISEESAREYTEKVLGGQSTDFWSQIKANKQNEDILAILIKDPFMLEGLICIYRNDGGVIPRNTGALLDKLIRTQWTRSKIDVKNWVELDDALFVLGELVIKDVPAVRYPVSVSGEGMPARWKGPYVGMLLSIGSWMRWKKESQRGWTRFAQKSYQRVEKRHPIIRWLVIFALNPLGLIWSFFVFIVSFPIDRIIYICRRWFEKNDWWKALDFFYRIEAFFDTLSDKIRIAPKIDQRNAKRLLFLAEKAHIIDWDGKSIRFRHKAWVDYFAAGYVIHNGANMEALSRGDNFNRGWRRLAPERAGIAVCVSGLLDDPEKFLHELLARDPYLLTQCLSSGINLRSDFSKFQETLVDEIKNVILDVRDAGEMRSTDFSIALQSLRYEPEDALVILDAIKKCEIDWVNVDLTKLIVNYGKDVVDILIFRLKTANTNEKMAILRALAWIGDKRAVWGIQDMLASLEDDEYGLIRKRAETILAVCFGDETLSKNLIKYLFLSSDERGYYWMVLKEIGSSSLLWAIPQISTWRIMYSDRQRIIKQEFLRLCRPAFNNQAVKAVLKKSLHSSSERDLNCLYIEALGNLGAIDEKDYLLEQLNSTDDQACLSAISALEAIKDSSTIPHLVQKRYHANEWVRQKAAEAIRTILREQAGAGEPVSE